MKTVDINGYTNDEHLLHFDGDHMDHVVDAAWRAIREEAIRQNPDLSQDTARRMLLCGGCLNTFMNALSERILQEAVASRSEREDWHSQRALRHIQMGAL